MDPNRTRDQLSPLHYQRQAIVALILVTILLALASDATALPSLPFAVNGSVIATARLGDPSGSVSFQADSKSSTRGSSQALSAAAQFVDTATVTFPVGLSSAATLQS